MVSSAPDEGVVVNPIPGAVKSMRSMYATLVFAVVLSAVLTTVACARLMPINCGAQDENEIVAAVPELAKIPLASRIAAI